MAISDDDMVKGAVALVVTLYGWVLRVLWVKVDTDHAAKCVKATSCKEDRESMLTYVKEVKTDLHSRIDRMENNIISAIRGK